MRISAPVIGFLLLSAAGAALGATPQGGTLSLANPTVAFTSGPFAVQNNSDIANPTCTGSGLPVTSAVDCDDFALTVDLPANYRATHKRDLLFVTVKWTIANFDAYGLYVLDAAGRVIDYYHSERDPVTVSIPAAPGTYTIRIVPLQTSPEILNATVTLLPDQTAAATGIAPRFIPQPTPPALGNELEAEMNIGYNPRTKRAFTLGFTHTLRTTFGDAQTPAQPECCDALWEEVSDPNSQINTNDPILFTDQATGRTFVSQLQPALGHSIFLYTDDDGASWTQSPTTANGGIDHQSVGVGPYPATLPPLAMPSWPASGPKRAVYFCSQSVAAAFCIRSDDGGDTFTRESVLVSAADCAGWTPYIHGHVKVAADGTVYVPLGNCGGTPSVIVSEDAGTTWAVRHLPSKSAAGDGDPSIGVTTGGTMYVCYIMGDGHVHAVASSDKGKTWDHDRDLGYSQGVVRAVFPTAVAGDPDRAACAFIGTSTPGGNFQGTDFQGLWYPYIATTYDGGLSWHTVNATPDDPVQGRGGIALGGATAIENRNLLDFNEITLDEKGRVLFGFDDGCVAESCILTGNPHTTDLPSFVSIITDIFAPGAVPEYLARINDESKTTILRQSGGRSLYRAFDDAAGTQLNSATPIAPAAACLNGSGRDATRARLVWKAPDNGGADISGYKIYRGTAPGAETFLADADPTVFFDDTTTNPLITDYYYKVTALNSRGEGVFSNAVKLAIGTLPAQPNNPPVARLAATPSSGTFPLAVHFDASRTTDADGDAIRSYIFDFGDGSDVVTQAGPSIDHTYAVKGTYVATVKAIDALAHRSQNAGSVTITEAITPPNTAPVASLSSDVTSGDAPLAVTFTVSGTDADNDTLGYDLDFGDSSTHSTSSGSVTHGYASAGDYPATLTVSDGKGGTDVKAVTIHVTTAPPANHPPVATLSPPTATIHEGEAVSFNVGATDEDGDALTVDLDFGDGSAHGTQTGIVGHSYTTTGNYTATLTVSDGRGGAASQTASITVQPAAIGSLVVHLAADKSGGDISNGPITVTFTASVENDDGTPLQYTFAFGDGETSTVTQAGNVITHDYAYAGTYHPYVTATQEYGARAATSGANEATITATTHVTVNPALAAKLLYDFPAGNVAPADVVFSTDGSAGDSYTLEFGDGDKTEGTGAPPASITHHYASPQAFTATLTVRDAKGSVSNSQTFTLVAKQQLTALVQVSASEGTSPLEVTIDGCHSVPGNGHRIASFTVDFGDGTDPVTQTVDSAHVVDCSGVDRSSDPSRFTHTYTVTSSKTFFPTLTVTDDVAASSFATYSTGVAVTPPAVEPPPVEPPVVETPPASGGGHHGGSFGWLTLLPLFGAALRRRTIRTR